MLQSLKRITYFVDDIEKAKQWYSAVLESDPVFDSPFAVIYTIGTCSLSLAKAMNSLPDPDKRMDVYWEVDDIDAAVEKFVQHGAGIQTPVKQALNIRIAQVIDPFGNIIGLTGDLQKKEERTVEKKPSETARTVAFCRALAANEQRKDIEGPDTLAELFLADEEKQLLRDEKARMWTIQHAVTSPLYGYFIARTAYLDEIFSAACDDDIPQIVFLGAGYDTRAYRYIDRLKRTRIFELDISTTQQNKIEILQKNKVAIPDSLSFVPINFKTGNLHEVLQEAGYDDDKKTLFIWEGVTYYLTKEDIEKTLHSIQRYSPEGSILCFDYMTRKLESINTSEPFKFWTNQKGIDELLSRFGMRIEEHIDPAEMKKRYLTLRDGTIAESVMTSFCFAKALLVK